MAPPLSPKIVSTPSSASTCTIASDPIIVLPASGWGVAAAPSSAGTLPELRDDFTSVGICIPSFVLRVSNPGLFYPCENRINLLHCKCLGRLLKRGVEKKSGALDSGAPGHRSAAQLGAARWWRRPVERSGREAGGPALPAAGGPVAAVDVNR